jgi:hypothetical protein
VSSGMVTVHFLIMGIARFLGVGYPIVYHIGKKIAIGFWIFEA